MQCEKSIERQQRDILESKYFVSFQLKINLDVRANRSKLQIIV